MPERAALALDDATGGTRGLQGNTRQDRGDMDNAVVVVSSVIAAAPIIIRSLLVLFFCVQAYGQYAVKLKAQ